MSKASVTNALKSGHPMSHQVDEWSKCVDDAGAETVTNVLPNEILLHIFRFLGYDDLINAEQVCSQWKTMVETCFAIEKQLSLDFFKEGDSYYRMKRYGSSVKTLKFRWYLERPSSVNWAEEIADQFSRLITLDLSGIPMSDDDFKYLSTKCSQLTNVTLSACDFTAEGLRIFLQALPEIKVLSISRDYLYLDIILKLDFEDSMPPIAVSAVFSTCRSLHTFKMFGRCELIDRDCFLKFCEECVTLRKLVIKSSNMPNEIFAQIQHCSLLEELDLNDCERINDSTLIKISKGCRSLRSLSLDQLDIVTSDVGLKCFARSRNLNSFKTNNKKVTDETLVELSKCVNLRKVTLFDCPLVSDRGCDALLAHCPRLELLDVQGCKGVSDATVFSAIRAVENRQNGLVLQLMVTGTRITPQVYENCHPLLRLVLDIDTWY